MTRGPAVSVIVPSFNLGRYLDEAVDSVLSQTFQDFEIVIVDDGSTDPETTALLARYERPRTRVITTEHRGLASARNLAIAESSGRYLCALDADDRLAPTYLEKAVRILDEDPSIAFVSSWVEMFGEETRLWKQEACDLPTLLAEDTVHTAAVVRRSVVLEAGGYDAAMPSPGEEDWGLWLAIVERGHCGVILPDVLFYYRRRPGSMSTVCTVGDTHLSLVRYIVTKHAASYQRHLGSVLLRKDSEVADLLRDNDETERHLDGWLIPQIALRRAERDALRHKLDTMEAAERETTGTQARLHHLDSELARARAEVHALRDSMSWKVTAPLRSLYGWLLRLRGTS